MIKGFLFLLLIFSCNDDSEKKGRSIVDFIDNEITGSPLKIEISEDEKISIEIQSDTLYKYKNGNIIMFGGVYADLYDSKGIKSSEMHSDSAIIFNNSDSVKAFGNIEVESVKGNKLLTTEIVLYNDIKLVHTDKNVIFTSNQNDTLYGKGFWSNYDMSNSKILKPTGVIDNN
tara:strand:- start:263 stop:781 length:519 start_codon:yes stop_codon:yes gene_type:complete